MTAAQAKRIAELEAEVERLNALLERACACWGAWQKYALGLEQGRIHIRPELEATIEEIYRKYGTPGGGRESGGNAGLSAGKGGDRGGSGSPPNPAAAIPAARKERE